MTIFSVAASFCAIALPFASAGEAMTNKKSFSALVEKAGVAAMKKVTNRRKLDQMSLERGRVFRQLEEDVPPECESAYNALWEDASLNATGDAYRADLLAALKDVSPDAACTDNGSGDISCDLSESVPSETAFRDACTAAGGDVAEFPLDRSCSFGAARVFLDLPPFLDCFPSGDDFAFCKTYLFDAYNLAYDAGIEEGLAQGGVTNVVCTSVVEPTAAPAGGGGDSYDGEPEVPGGGDSSASMRGYGLVASTAMFGAALLLV